METIQVIRDIVIIGSGLFFVVGVVVAIVYVLPVCSSLRRLTDEWTRTLIGLEEQGRKLGDTLSSVRALTDSVTESHRRSIDPTLQHVEEMADRMNRAAKEMSYAVDDGVRFTRQTIEQFTFYRDRILRPLIEIASLWRGIRAVQQALPHRRSKRR